MRTHALIFLWIITSFTMITTAQEKKSKWSVVEVKTSAQCELCKARIEEALAFESGVKSSNLDLTSKVVTVEFKEGKTNAEKIRKAITLVGYDADDQLADPKAYKKLPACCKKPDDPEFKGHE